MTGILGPGLFQKTAGGVWFCRKPIPHDLRGKGGGRDQGGLPSAAFVSSLKTKDPDLAKLRRDAKYAIWDEQIAAVRASGDGFPLSVENVRAAINVWRQAQCAIAAGLDDKRSARPIQRPKLSELDLKSLFHTGGLKPVTGDGPNEIYIGGDVAKHAKLYFERNPEAPKTLEPDPQAFFLRTKLKSAITDSNGWDAIDNYDEEMTKAVAFGGITVKLTTSLRNDARPYFSAAWLEVVENREAERKRAASFLAALEVVNPATAFPPTPTKSYVPRADDRSVKNVIEHYKGWRNGQYGEESTIRKYKHIFSAFEDVFGPDTIARTLTHEDAERVKRVLRKAPAHAGKRYPGLSLEDAIAETESDDDVQRMAPNTINHYLSAMSAIFNYALKKRWVDHNPALGLVDNDMPVVERRAFSAAELVTIFDGLKEERKENTWRFWVPAIALFTGARLNEICQLDRDNLRELDGNHFLRLTVFDKEGRRRAGQKIKTDSSQRNIPLHRSLVQAGLVDFINSQGAGRIFSSLNEGPNGGYSHTASKWWARYLDGLRITDPSLVFHSFRHGFRDACDIAEIAPETRRVLGGWANNSESEKYGNAQFIPVLSREIEKIRFAGFDLNDAI